MAVEAMVSTEHASTPTQVKLVVEGLLAHFFSADQPKYVLEDVKWFLKLLNKQQRWFSVHQGGSDSSEEDMIDSDDESREVVNLEGQVGDSLQSLKPQVEVCTISFLVRFI